MAEYHGQESMLVEEKKAQAGEESAEAAGQIAQGGQGSLSGGEQIKRGGNPALEWRRRMSRRVQKLEHTVSLWQKRVRGLEEERMAKLQGNHPLKGQPVGGGFQEFKIDWAERHKADLRSVKQASVAWKQLDAESKAVFVEQFNEKLRRWHDSRSQQLHPVASTQPCRRHQRVPVVHQW